MLMFESVIRLFVSQGKWYCMFTNACQTFVLFFLFYCLKSKMLVTAISCCCSCCFFFLFFFSLTTLFLSMPHSNCHAIYSIDIIRPESYLLFDAVKSKHHQYMVDKNRQEKLGIQRRRKMNITKKQEKENKWKTYPKKVYFGQESFCLDFPFDTFELNIQYE